MMGGGVPSAPAPVMAPPAAAPATQASSNVAASGANKIKRGTAGADGTVGAAGPEGLQAKPLTAPATLLGGTS